MALASRPPAEAHLDILHTQDVPAVVHVLLKVFVLDKRKGVRVDELQAQKPQQLLYANSTPQRLMNNINNKKNTLMSSSLGTITSESCIAGGDCRSCFSGLTRYSKTSVSDLSVWTMSCSVTMLACFRSFSRDTKKRVSVITQFIFFDLIHNAPLSDESRVHTDQANWFIYKSFRPIKIKIIQAN